MDAKVSLSWPCCLFTTLARPRRIFFVFTLPAHERSLISVCCSLSALCGLSVFATRTRLPSFPPAKLFISATSQHQFCQR